MRPTRDLELSRPSVARSVSPNGRPRRIPAGRRSDSLCDAGLHGRSRRAVHGFPRSASVLESPSRADESDLRM